MDEKVTLILVLVSLLIGFLIGIGIQINYTYEVYTDVMEAVENVIMQEVEKDEQ